MHELKFRVWNKYNNSYQYDLNIDCNGKLVEIDEKFQSAYVIQQYTGLKDKNGKEIYEGDIIKLTHKTSKRKYLIEYYDGAFWFRRGDNEMILGLHYKFCKILGNIFETPELLK